VNNTIKDILNDPQFPEGTAWNRCHFHQGEVIIREGDKGRSLFYIENGKMRVTGQVKLDEDCTFRPGIWELEAGDVFGEMCLYEEQVRSASVICVKAGDVLELDGQSLSIYLDDHPVQGYLFLKDIFGILIARLNRANHKLEEMFAWGLKVHEMEKYL